METIPHYYGNIVRNIFLICGILLLVTLPFLKDSISSPLFFSIFSILVLTFFAGVTTPKHRGIIVSDIGISIVFFGLFTYRAVSHFDRIWDLFFLTHIVLACLCLLAFYWSLKTFRWLNSPAKIAIEDIPASGTPGEGLNETAPIALAAAADAANVANVAVSKKEAVKAQTSATLENSIIHVHEETPPKAETIIIKAPATETHHITQTEEERRKSRFLSSES